MSSPYEELLDGQVVFRRAPGTRHEMVCTRLLALLDTCVANLSTTRILPRRSQVQLPSGSIVCPDIALIDTATGKLWLAIEIISSDDHHTDTVIKKQIYEDMRLPRLWIVDPRYDNLEVYHSSEYGLALKGIMAGNDVLTDTDLPGFQVTIRDLFA